MDPEEDRWVRSDDAKRHMRTLLDDVEHKGEHVYVLRYDKPAAVVVPVDWYEEAKAQLGEPDGGK